MLEDNYLRRLNKLIEACECDLAVPSEWQDCVTRRGVIQPIPGRKRMQRQVPPALREIPSTLLFLQLAIFS